MSAAAWLDLRQRATVRAGDLGLPTPALEDWRYVDCAPLARVPTAAPLAITGAEVRPHLIGLDTIVLVDGRLREDLAVGEPAAAVDDLLVHRDGAALAAQWAQALAGTADIDACWSLADCAGALRIRARGAVERPLHVLSLATGGASGARLVVDCADGALLDLVVTHVALGPARSSLGIDVVLGRGAALRLDEVQDGDGSHCHRGGTVRLAADAALDWTTAATGGALVRFRTDVRIAGAHAEARLAGIAVLDGERQAHHLVRVHHDIGEATSSQLFKAVADGRARTSFDGLIGVAKGADGTSAFQENHNLLLADTARADARPQLDILADDVKASHGATVGQPNPEEVFYLRSRGLDRAAAFALLTHGFAEEVVLAMRNAAARALAERVVVGRLGR